MGYYIEGPIHGKAESILSTERAKAKRLDAAPSWPPPSGRAFVCVVNNGPFEAAGWCYSAIST